MFINWPQPVEENTHRLRRALLKKDTITVNLNCENTPLHSAILGGEMPAVQILLNFDHYLEKDFEPEV